MDRQAGELAALRVTLGSAPPLLWLCLLAGVAWPCDGLGVAWAGLGPGSCLLFFSPHPFRLYLKGKRAGMGGVGVSHQDSQQEKPGRGSHLRRHLSAPDCPLLFRLHGRSVWDEPNQTVFQGVLPGTRMASATGLL